MIWIVLGFLVLISATSLYKNYKEFDGWAFFVDINKLNSELFELGLSNRHWHDSQGNCIQTFTLGLYLINISMDFFYINTEDDSTT